MWRIMFCNSDKACPLSINPVRLVAPIVLGFPHPPISWIDSFQKAVGKFNGLPGAVLKHRVSFIPFFNVLFRANRGWRLVNPQVFLYEVDTNGCQDEKYILHEFLTIQVVHDQVRQVGETSDFSSQKID